MSNKNVVWIAMDVETEGDTPGIHSMLSLGAIALDENLEELGRWYGTFLPLPNTRPQRNNQDWWRGQSQAVYRAARDGARDPRVVTREFVDWINGFDRIPYAVLGPTGFDWPFIYYYINVFGRIDDPGMVNSNPFRFRTRDLRTLAAAYLGREVSKDKWPKRWFNKAMPHTHHALEDAAGLAFTFAAIMRDLNAKNAEDPGTIIPVANIE